MDGMNYRYPANCIGMGELWKRVVSKYPRDWFKFNTTVKAIDPDKKIVKVVDKFGKASEIEYDYLISTIPLTILGSITGLYKSSLLKHSKVHILLINKLVPKTSFINQSLSVCLFISLISGSLIWYRITFTTNTNSKGFELELLSPS